MPRKIRASKDEETQPPLTQRPGFIIGMTFLAVVAAVIISVLIFRFIQRRKAASEAPASMKAHRVVNKERLEYYLKKENLNKQTLDSLLELKHIEGDLYNILLERINR